MYREALAAPVQSSDAVPTLVVGGALVAFSVMVPAALGVAATRNPVALVAAPLAPIVPLVLLGYELRVMRAGARGTDGTPSFVDWAGLIRGGVASVVVSVVYLVPAVAVSAAGLALAVDFGGPGGLVAASDPGATAAVGAGGVVGAACLLGFLYVRPAALATYAATGRLRSAVGPRRVLGVAVTREYAVGWLLAGVTLLVGLAVAVPLAVLLVGVPLAFYVRVVAASLYGRGAGTALDVDAAAAPGGAGPADDSDGRDGGGGPDRSPTADWAAGGLVGEDPGEAPGEGVDPPSPVSGVPADELEVVPDGADDSRLADPDEVFASFDVGDEESQGEWTDEEWGDEQRAEEPPADVRPPESEADVEGTDVSGAAGSDDGFEWGTTADEPVPDEGPADRDRNGEDSHSGDDRRPD
jgi:hypothetical protein